MLNSIFTLRGKEGLKKTIVSGRVIKSPTIKDPIRVAETIIGIGRMNSPINPADKSKGENAQTVVIVVTKRVTLKSFQTKRPASIGENFPDL